LCRAGQCSDVRRGADLSQHGYGYIERGDARADGGYGVKRFIEKPNSQFAQELLLQGKAFWNAGIFLCTAVALLAAMEQHAPDTGPVPASHGRARIDGDFVRPAGPPLAACRSESIDYAVMERHTGVAVFPFHALWSDVGSWNALADICPPDQHGNRIEGLGVAVNAKNARAAPMPAERPSVTLQAQSRTRRSGNELFLAARPNATREECNLNAGRHKRRRPAGEIKTQLIY